MSRDDTIAALATAPGAAAVAVVRVSGPDARAIAATLSGRAPAPRRAELRTLRSADGEPIDTGLVLYFPAPASYTGEDVVELQIHGGAVTTDWLLETLYRLGARAAAPGEFTLRAFLNDKLDLAQAEAVADLVASRSRLGAAAALRSLQGRFSDDVGRLQAALTGIRVHVEAWLDFPDEEIDRAAAGALAERLAAARADLDALVAATARGVALSSGLSLAIVGPPNAGKSSLLNALAGYDAAIVTEIPGTTRDTVRERLVLDGLAVDVVDTAGLRETTETVEAEGVRRARLELGRADHVVWVGDVRDGFERVRAEARGALGAAADDATAHTLVLNKIDLAGRAARSTVRDGEPAVELSALTGDGVALLIERLKAVAGLGGDVAGSYGARRRHVDALERTARHLAAAAGELDGALELAAEELRGAQAALSEITGELTSDDLLGEIFSGFCIGK